MGTCRLVNGSWRRVSDFRGVVQDLPAIDLYRAITNDFESNWNPLARNERATGRGNFMFARQAMMLLEWASRLATSVAITMSPRDVARVCRPSPRPIALALVPAGALPSRRLRSSARSEAEELRQAFRR